MISFDNAQLYFRAENHHKSAVWAGFGTEHRKGAIAAARRVLSRGLARAMRDDEAAYVEGDRTRDEFSVYEQSLWMLENGQVADATGNDPIPVLTGRPDAAESTKGPGSDVYAPEALRWLGMTGGAVVRG